MASRLFLLEVPKEVVEAAAMDGAGLLLTIRRVLLPIVSPGLAATALIEARLAHFVRAPVSGCGRTSTEVVVDRRQAATVSGPLPTFNLIMIS